MNVLMRIMANLACFFGCVWLVCQSVPLLTLVATSMSGPVQAWTFIFVGVADLAVMILLFVVVNLYISEEQAG